MAPFPICTTGAGVSFGWAPNSRSLAIDEAGGHQLVIRGLDGRIRVIRRTGKTTAMGSVTWSPDGRWISYDRDNLGGGNGVGCCSSSIHLIHPDGSGDHAVAMVHEAIHDVPYTVAAWSAGEMSVVIVGAQTGGSPGGVFEIGAVDLELVDLAGGPPRMLTQLPSGSSVQLVAVRPTD